MSEPDVEIKAEEQVPQINTTAVESPDSKTDTAANNPVNISASPDKNKDFFKKPIVKAGMWASVLGTIAGGAVGLSSLFNKGDSSSSVPERSAIVSQDINPNNAITKDLVVPERADISADQEALTAADKVIDTYINVDANPMFKQLKADIESGSMNNISIEWNNANDAQGYAGNADHAHVDWFENGRNEADQSQTPDVKLDIIEGHAGTDLTTRVAVTISLPGQTPEQIRDQAAVLLKEDASINVKPWRETSFDGKDGYMKLAGSVNTDGVSGGASSSLIAKDGSLQYIYDYPSDPRVNHFFVPNLKHFPGGNMPAGDGSRVDR